MQKKIYFNAFMTLAVMLFLTESKAQICTITCPANITVPAALNQCGALVTYPPATATGLFCGPLSYSRASGTFFPVGTTTVTVTGTGAPCSFTVTVVDRQAPAISGLAAVPNSLWPPNHKMNNVSVNYTTTDNCPGAIGCTLSVTSNEPVNSTGDGNTAPDWVIVNNHLVQLRAERKGNGDGRVYTVGVTCTDLAGNVSRSSTTVTVAHDQSGKKKSETSPGTDLNEQIASNGLAVKALQNPTRSYFTLNISSNNLEKISLNLYDMSGRVVESKNNINAGQVRVGNELRSGVYFAEIRQGNAVKKLRLVKQSD
jgi:hypothetical protein